MPPEAEALPATTKVRSSRRLSAPKRLARRRAQARSSPDALWPGRGTTSVRPRNAPKPSAVSRRVPSRTSSSGKASRARRYWSAMIAFMATSARELRSTQARPTSSDGVPPMRSKVQKEYPRSFAPSRAWVTSTHSSRSFDKKPMSKAGSRSAHRSAISASSASLSAVQSFVATTIPMGQLYGNIAWCSQPGPTSTPIQADSGPKWARIAAPPKLRRRAARRPTAPVLASPPGH